MNENSAVRDKLEMLRKYMYRELNRLKAGMPGAGYGKHGCGWRDCGRFNFGDTGPYSERLKVLKHRKALRRPNGRRACRKHKYTCF